MASAPSDSAQGKTSETGASNECAFNESITIHYSSPCPQYDKGPVRAFSAQGRDRYPASLFAMICDDRLLPRMRTAAAYASLANPAAAKLVASGPVYWPPAGKEKFCLIYENDHGNALMPEDRRGGLGLRPESLVNSVIRPMVALLSDFRDRDIFHGNIRPSNIFDGGKKGLEKIILGDCLSLPPSYNQPVLYETIERGMTTPVGKGVGTQSADIYALGVTLAVMMRYADPMEGYTDEEIVEKKIEEGSYTALLGRERLSGAMLELMRGMLGDRDEERWTLDDILVWFDGRRLSPKQALRRPKAARPLTFNNEKYLRPEILARDLYQNIGETQQLVENGEMEQWLQRALEDKWTSERYEKALFQAQEGGKGGGYAERLATRLSIALHPAAPMRFRAANVHPDGVGTAFFETYAKKGDIQGYVDFFMNYFITQWLDSQASAVSDIGGTINKFDSARAFLRQKGPGGGVERCLYMLEPEAYCLSEKFAKFYVRTPEEMLLAFEKSAKGAPRPSSFFDRHILAFLAVRDRKIIEPFFNDLTAVEAYRRISAEIKILALIQKRSQMEKFPALAAWIVDSLEPLYARFHDRSLREDVKRKAEKMKEGGDLSKIAALFDNPAVYEDDNARFRRAMRDYHGYTAEMDDTNVRLKDESSFGRAKGQKVAAFASGVLGGMIILATLFSNLGAGLFR